jgi:DNA-binding response OmpR family regulator
MKILVLDDEQDAADMLSAVFTLYLPEAGIRVVHTGDNALAAASEQRPDAAIIDLKMSGLDGEGVARALRSAFPDTRLLLIALSGNVLRLGALSGTGTLDYLLTKPVDVAVLVELLTHSREASPGAHDSAC